MEETHVSSEETADTVPTLGQVWVLISQWPWCGVPFHRRASPP